MELLSVTLFIITLTLLFLLLREKSIVKKIGEELEEKEREIIIAESSLNFWKNYHAIRYDNPKDRN